MWSLWLPMCTSKMAAHTRTHTGEKRYTCEHCDFHCALKSSIKIHVRTHTGEKPYACEHCDYRYTQISDIKKRVETYWWKAF